MKTLHRIRTKISPEWLQASWVINNRYRERYWFRPSPDDPEVMQFRTVSETHWYNLSNDDLKFYARNPDEGIDDGTAIERWVNE